MRCGTAQGKKAKRWTGIAVDRLTRQVIAFVIGRRDRNMGRLLWNQGQALHSSGTARVTGGLLRLPAGGRRVRSKKETYTIEGCNARLRHYIARFQRKTKCYSKADHMIEMTLKLAFYKFNYS